MPNAANIIVQDALEADCLFEVLTPSGGDGGVARYALKRGAAPVAFPSMTVVARPTTNASRKTSVKVHVPHTYTDPVTGLLKKGPAFELNIEASMPDAFPEDARDDAVAFGVNLAASPLMRQVFRDGYGLV